MTVAILTIALIISVALNVLSAALVSRTSANALDKLDRAHERTTEYTGSLIDRIMSMDFQTYKAYSMLEEEANAVDDEPDLPLVVMGPDKGGFGSRLGLRALSSRHVQDDQAQVRATEELLESELPR